MLAGILVVSLFRVAGHCSPLIFIFFKSAAFRPAISYFALEWESLKISGRSEH